MESLSFSDGVQETSAGPTPIIKRSAIPLLVAAIGAGELVLVFVNLAIGVLLEAVTLGVILALQAALSRRIDGRAIVPLALVPLLRLLSLTTPLPGIPIVYWLALVGAPLAVGGVFAARGAGLGLGALGLRRTRWLPQAAIAGLGVPAGLGAWFTAGPTTLIDDHAAPAELLVIGLLLAVFVGITEEFIFRGVIQAGLSLVYPRGAIAFTAILYGSSYLGSLSFGYAAYMTLVGLVYGILVRQTGSILGACASHAILIVGALIAWPALMA